MHGYLWICMDAYGYLLIFMCISDSMEIYGDRWGRRGPARIDWPPGGQRHSMLGHTPWMRENTGPIAYDMIVCGYL